MGVVKTLWYKPDFWMNYDYVGDDKKSLDMWITQCEKEHFAKFIQVVKQNPDGTTMCLFRLRKPRFLAKTRLLNEERSFETLLVPFERYKKLNSQQKE